MKHYDVIQNGWGGWDVYKYDGEERSRIKENCDTQDDGWVYVKELEEEETT